MRNGNRGTGRTLGALAGASIFVAALSACAQAGPKPSVHSSPGGMISNVRGEAAMAVPVPAPAPIGAAGPAPGPAPRIVAPPQPRAHPSALISDADYPESALRAREEGVVGYALEVWTNGRATNCTVTRSSGSRSLDATTCRIMRSRARFTPARDSQGNPAVSWIEQEVVWRLPAAR